MLFPANAYMEGEICCHQRVGNLLTAAFIGRNRGPGEATSGLMEI